jgi:hypothetical protein
MRAMSWSRYRCLSRSFVRIRMRLRRRKTGPQADPQILRYGTPGPDGPGNTGSR